MPSDISSFVSSSLQQCGLDVSSLGRRCNRNPGHQSAECHHTGQSACSLRSHGNESGCLCTHAPSAPSRGPLNRMILSHILEAVILLKQTNDDYSNVVGTRHESLHGNLPTRRVLMLRVTKPQLSSYSNRGTQREGSRVGTLWALDGARSDSLNFSW